MKDRIFQLLVVSCLISLNACANGPTLPETAGINMGISDMPCDEVVSSIPTILEEKGYPFEWVDDSKGQLSIGPMTQTPIVDGGFSTIRQTYSLTASCEDELTTSIVLEIKLEGFNADKEWIEINDVRTLNEYGMQFLESLDL